MAFAAGANGLIVGLGAPTHVKRPVFDPKLPGSWLVDLSHVDLSRVKVGKEWVELDGSMLPSPFAPKGEHPEGPAWYATPTVAYAVELGYDVAPPEAWVRYENGRHLDGWYNRLRDAYLRINLHRKIVKHAAGRLQARGEPGSGQARGHAERSVGRGREGAVPGPGAQPRPVHQGRHRHRPGQRGVGRR